MENERMKRISRYLVISLVVAMAGEYAVLAQDPSATAPVDSISAPTPATDAGASTPTTTAPSTGAPGRINSSWLDDLDSPLPVHFGLFASETYDDNIFLQPNKTYDYVSHIAPSLSYVMGDPEATDANYLSAFYSPTFLIYGENTRENSVEEDVNVQYAYTFTKLRLSIQQQYQRLADATVDADDIVKRSIYTTTAAASYDYNDRLSFQMIGTQTITDYDDQFRANTNEWTINAFFLYELTPKLKLGFGPLVGFLDEEYAPNQTYEQFLAHLQYQATGKITISLSLGGEDRQYQYGESDQLTPVFDLRTDYQATDATSLFLDGHAETYSSSTLQGENYQDVAIQGGISQRFFQKFFLSISGGYDHSTYRDLTNSDTFDSHRIDDYYFGKAGVSWIPNNWLTVSGSYQYSTDDSNFEFAKFTDNQYSVSCQLKY
jgi:hypothetical protein